MSPGVKNVVRIVLYSRSDFPVVVGEPPSRNCAVPLDGLLDRSLRRFRVAVIPGNEDVSAPVLAADHALGRKLHKTRRIVVRPASSSSASCRSDGKRPPGPSWPAAIKSLIERSTRSVLAPTPPLARRPLWRGWSMTDSGSIHPPQVGGQLGIVRHPVLRHP
jgi:hypothetical protein